MTVFIYEATVHSMERIKERAGMKNSEEMARYIASAVARGKRAEEYTSIERKYLETVDRKESNRKAIAYDGMCFIFTADEEICITMFPLPAWFGKKKHFNGKTKIRHPHRYIHYNADYLLAV